MSGRSRLSSRVSSTASPKRRKRPPLQVPIAVRPGSRTGRRLGVFASGLVALGQLAARVLALALLGADADLLGLRFGLLRPRRLLRLDDLQAQRLVLLVARGVALDDHRRA